MVVLRTYYLSILEQELDSAKTDECNLLGERSVNERHQYNMAAKFVALVVENPDKLHML